MKFDYVIGNGRDVKGQTQRNADFTLVSKLWNLLLLSPAA